MSLVNVHNEWDPLEEIIIGTAHGARVPAPDLGLFTISFHEYGAPVRIPSGPFPDGVIQQTDEELAELAVELAKLGVIVRRPATRDLSALTKTPDWQTDGYYDYCPRDGILTVGDMIIETPMVLRARFLEQFSYKELCIEYFQSGARWLSAPKPRLADSMYDPAAPAGRRLRNHEPAFDAANVLRFGADLLYLVSDSGNELGWQWLQSVLGPEYQVHPCHDLYAATHVDSTIVPLRPGLVLINPERVNDHNFPDFLKGWDQIICPDLADTGYVGDQPRCSVWIGMNLLVIRPGLVVADRRQKELISALERHGIDVLPMQLTHARSLGGGFHCATLDVRRTGNREIYR